MHPPGNPRPCSSVYSQDEDPFGDNFSLEDLARRVDESTKVSESNTLVQLGIENQILSQHVAYYQREWDALIDLLEELIDAVLLITSTLKNFNHKREEAETAWLAFWGIKEEASCINWI
ncbi:uncharacterized protein EAF01_010132 [Botrytis porri]|uniref:Uncharacterized protein n=1 Tax=Botrytis porri TaxID=87229 RepID=A0A4Z1L245_9HELO|nr:uncharacterized protein EAF01_010132 [Botrytis porri]KAF7894682.1 hypothetical protein EAF01_010132 [Botrytis porri]TGO90892.1 hypothetical protein BPOR_0047g00150 [Botrytis porri]